LTLNFVISSLIVGTFKSVCNTLLDIYHGAMSTYLNHIILINVKGGLSFCWCLDGSGVRSFRRQTVCCGSQASSPDIDTPVKGLLENTSTRNRANLYIYFNFHTLHFVLCL
jgi:hypothetical protein